MFVLVMTLVMLAGSLEAQLNVDLSTAMKDPITGDFCVLQKVCITNPPEALARSGCAPQYPPGCDCDSDAPDADSVCTPGHKCVQCKCLPPGCDCDPMSANPDGFCMSGEVCKDCKCGLKFPPGCDCDPNPMARDRDSTCSAGEMCVQCKCLPAGCDCDPFSSDPDGFCPIGEVCKDCKCGSRFPPGCDCDPLARGRDSTCSARETCVQCKCLPAGCDCDPFSANPDGFCPVGEVCQDCKCASVLPAGCDCNPDLPNADDFCPGDDRCVGCVCRNCPASTKDSKVINPPLVFVIDTTKSVKPDKDSIFNLTRKVVQTIMQDEINIPRYQLVTFNDFGPAINRNVRLEIDTDDVVAFGKATAGLKFESYTGGRDSKERLTQGLLVALQNSSPKSLIVVFTDNGSKDLGLEKEINRLRKTKECEVYIVLTPEYEGRKNGKSLPVYNRMGQVFLISDVGADSFLQRVEQFEEQNCL